MKPSKLMAFKQVALELVTSDQPLFDIVTDAEKTLTVKQYTDFIVYLTAITRQ